MMTYKNIFENGMMMMRKKCSFNRLFTFLFFSSDFDYLIIKTRSEIKLDEHIVSLYSET